MGAEQPVRVQPLQRGPGVTGHAAARTAVAASRTSRRMPGRPAAPAAPPSPPRCSTATAASASPSRTAEARSAMSPPNRQVLRSSTTDRRPPRPRARRRARRRPTQAGPPRGSAVAGGQPGDQVREHGTGLDGRELVGVTDQEQPGVGPDRLQEPGHHRQRHHRRLVDHDEVERQPVVAIVPEPGAAVREPAEQPVQRRRRERAAGRAGPLRSNVAASCCTASCNRAAALPVGAAIATRSGGPGWSAAGRAGGRPWWSCRCPGRRRARSSNGSRRPRAASRCCSASAPGKSRRDPARARSTSTSGGGCASRASRSRQTWSSCRQ